MSAVPVPSCCLISCNFYVLQHYLASESFVQWAYPFHLMAVLDCLAHNPFLLSDSAPYLCSKTTHSTLFPMTDSPLNSPLHDVPCFPLSWFMCNCLKIYTHSIFFSLFSLPINFKFLLLFELTFCMLNTRSVGPNFYKCTCLYISSCLLWLNIWKIVNIALT